MGREESAFEERNGSSERRGHEFYGGQCTQDKYCLQNTLLRLSI